MVRLSRTKRNYKNYSGNPLFPLVHLQGNLVVQQVKSEKLGHHPHFLPYGAFSWI